MSGIGADDGVFNGEVDAPFPIFCFNVDAVYFYPRLMTMNGCLNQISDVSDVRGGHGFEEHFFEIRPKVISQNTFSECR